MTPQILVLGAGYAGVAAVQSLESELDCGEVVWVSEDSHHFALHEAHRCIRSPSLGDELAIPVSEMDLDAERTRFVEGTVTDVAVDDREVELEDDRTLDYDYAVVALGSRTAFYGIDGLEEHALTLKSREDAERLRERAAESAAAADEESPARLVVGGAGLTGIQTAGELAAWRDETDRPVDVTLVEMEDHVFPGHDAAFQGALRGKLADAGVDLRTGATCVEVDDSTMRFEDAGELSYDVLLWAGGVTGREALDDAAVETDHDRAHTDATFETSDDRVYAIGDAALVDQDAAEGALDERVVWQRIAGSDTENVPPPTAEAAMEAGSRLGANLARRLRGDDPIDWRYADKGTLVSVGDDVVAHDVLGVPVETFGGPAARLLKRAVAARWLATVSSGRRAARAWSDL